MAEPVCYGRHSFSAEYIERSAIPRIAKYSKPLTGGCIEWTGELLWSQPFALLALQSLEGRQVHVRVNRLLAILRHGARAVSGRLVEPTCGNKWCVNEEHHRLVESVTTKRTAT